MQIQTSASDFKIPSWRVLPWSNSDWRIWHTVSFVSFPSNKDSNRSASQYFSSVFMMITRPTGTLCSNSRRRSFSSLSPGLNVGIITSAFLIFRTPYRLFCKNASESLPSSPATFSGTSPSHPPGAGCPRCRLSSSPPHERGRQSAVFPNR